MYHFQVKYKNESEKIYVDLLKKVKYKKAFLEDALISFFNNPEKRKLYFDLTPEEEKRFKELLEFD